MLRVIKFRVWDTKEKSFMDEDSEHGQFFNVSGRAYLTGIFNGSYKTLIPQQFTGLKDKNCKEIYEGDILKGDAENGNTIMRVGFIDSAFRVKYLNCVSEWSVQPMTKWGSENLLEIIGNIFENPELIKK